ncbi:MAG: L,D-transpeptidase family protein [Candidatus Omnitrophica bacterium]|nr:L,D-transpeptidase family protein [Candidatus Omnitrophota bacterium]
MSKIRLVFLVVFVVVILVTVSSYLTLHGAGKNAKLAGNFDKAQLLYTRAEEHIKNNDTDKAVRILTEITDKYRDSGYAEKSLESLTAMYISKGDSKKAEAYYNKLTKEFPGNARSTQFQADLKGLKAKKFNYSLDNEGNIVYVVKSGDTLNGISKKFNVTVGLIKKVNKLEKDSIYIGQKLKISVSTFSIIVDKAKNILILKKDGQVFKTYQVATGRNNSTPVGVFTIVDKMIEPAWTKPGVGIIKPGDKEYELGARWMPISVKGYGIHGTNDDTLIGKQATSGCVRMHNADVIELYDIVPKGTEVKIVDSM